MRISMILACVTGLACVAFGAFGAHGVADPKAQGWLRTGAEYGLVHALAVFAAAFVAERGGRAARWAAPLFLAGALLFCGALWTLALGGPRALGAVAPVGGLCFIAGWAILAWGAASVRRQA